MTGRRSGHGIGRDEPGTRDPTPGSSIVETGGVLRPSFSEEDWNQVMDDEQHSHYLVETLKAREEWVCESGTFHIGGKEHGCFCLNNVKSSANKQLKDRADAPGTKSPFIRSRRRGPQVPAQRPNRARKMRAREYFSIKEATKKKKKKSSKNARAQKSPVNNKTRPVKSERRVIRYIDYARANNNCVCNYNRSHLLLSFGAGVYSVVLFTYRPVVHALRCLFVGVRVLIRSWINGFPFVFEN